MLEFLEQGFPTKWGFTTRYPGDMPLGQVEEIVHLLMGKGNDEPYRFIGDAYHLLEEQRFTFLGEEGAYYHNAMIVSVSSAVSNIIRRHLPDSPQVLEVAAGGGLFSQNAVFPVVNERRGNLYPTELVHTGEEFRSIYDPSLRANLVKGVDIRALPFRSGAFDSVVAVSALDVIPPNHIDEAVSEITRALTLGGRVIHTLDLGAGFGWTRNPDEATRKEYEVALLENGVPIAGEITTRDFRKLTAKLDTRRAELRVREFAPEINTRAVNQEQVAGALAIMQNIFSGLWSFSRGSLIAKGFPKEKFGKIDIKEELYKLFHDPESINFTGNVFNLAQDLKFRNGRSRYAVPLEFIFLTMYSLMEKNLVGANTQEDFKKVEALLAIGRLDEIDKLVKKNNPDMGLHAVIVIMMSELSHILSRTLIKNAFGRAGLETIEEGFEFGDKVTVTDPRAQQTGYTSFAGVKIDSPADVPFSQAGVYYFVAEKTH